MKKYLLIMMLIPISLFSQRLSYTISPKKAQTNNETIALVVINKVPVEGSLPKIITALKAKGHVLVLSKEEINLTGINLKNSPFDPAILYALKFEVLNKNIGEALISLNITFYDLEKGGQKGMSISQSKENINQIAAEIALFLEGVQPKEASAGEVQVVGVHNDEISFPASAYTGLRKGDEIIISFPQASREGTTELRVRVKRVETATNTKGEFEKTVFAENKSNLIEVGDTILRYYPKRNRFSLSVMGAAAFPQAQVLDTLYKEETLKGQSLWKASFLLQGEYEYFMPYGFTSSTIFGLNVDGTINTFIMTGIGWRSIQTKWELIPAFRIGIAMAPLSLVGNAPSIQGSVVRLGLDVGLSFLYHISSSFSIGFDIGLQYWFYNIPLFYRGSQKVEIFFQGTEQLPLSSLYPRLGLKFSWLF